MYDDNELISHEGAETETRLGIATKPHRRHRFTEINKRCIYTVYVICTYTIAYPMLYLHVLYILYLNDDKNDTLLVG